MSAANVLTLGTAQEMVDRGDVLARELLPGDVVILDGQLGAGKTTFTRGIGAGLRVRGPITSPTFVIARVHPSLVDGPSLVHVDAYRVASLEDIDALDLDASIEDSVTVVEWGVDRVEQLIDSYLLIRLVRPDISGADVDDNADVRTLVWEAVGPRWGDRIPGLTQALS